MNVFNIIDREGRKSSTTLQSVYTTSRYNDERKNIPIANYANGKPYILLVLFQLPNLKNKLERLNTIKPNSYLEEFKINMIINYDTFSAIISADYC